MRIALLIASAILWALPAFAGPKFEALAKFVSSTPSARFALEQTSESAMIARLLGGQGAERYGVISNLRTAKGDTELVAERLLARLEKIEGRYRSEFMASNETFGQILLRRIVREELTVATKRGWIDRMRGLKDIEFVSAEAIRRNTIEEIFLDTAGREVAHPTELFDNISLLTGELKHLVKTGFNAADTQAAEWWVAKSLDNMSEASRYTQRAADAAVWEARLTGSELPIARTRAAIRDLKAIETSLKNALHKIRDPMSSLVTDSTFDRLREYSGRLHVASSRLDLAAAKP